MNKNNFIKLSLGLFYVFLIALLFVLLFFDKIDIDSILIYFGGDNYIGWLLLVLIVSVIALFLFPTNVLGLSVGFLINPFIGFLVMMVSLTITAFVSLIIGRYLLYDYLIRKKKKLHINSILKTSDQRVLTKRLVTARLTPFIPFGIVSYSFSITKIKTKYFLFGTFIGMIPKMFFHTMLGGSFRDLLIGDYLSFIAAISIVITLGIVIYYMWFKTEPDN